MSKLTVEQAMEHEKETLIDALLSGCIELNEVFLNRYAGPKVEQILLSVPEDERRWILEDAIGEAHWLGSPGSADGGLILYQTELEWQFDGEAEDYFEEPDEWVIDGDLAYLSLGYGLFIPINVERMGDNMLDLNWTNE